MVMKDMTKNPKIRLYVSKSVYLKLEYMKRALIVKPLMDLLLNHELHEKNQSMVRFRSPYH